MSHIHAHLSNIYQSDVVFPQRAVWSETFPSLQATLFHTHRIKKNKVYFLDAKMRARSTCSMQTNKPRFHHAFTVHHIKKRKTPVSNIEGDETTFLHLTVRATSCLHR